MTEDKVRISNKPKEKKKRKLRATVDIVAITTARHNLFHCTEKNCSRHFISQAYLQKHLASGQYLYGASNISQTNKMKKVKKCSTKELWNSATER
jgi:hypothetical protein